MVNRLSRAKPAAKDWLDAGTSSFKRNSFWWVHSRKSESRCTLLYSHKMRSCYLRQVLRDMPFQHCFFWSHRRHCVKDWNPSWTNRLGLISVASERSDAQLTRFSQCVKFWKSFWIKSTQTMRSIMTFISVKIAKDLTELFETKHGFTTKWLPTDLFNPMLKKVMRSASLNWNGAIYNNADNIASSTPTPGPWAQ